MRVLTFAAALALSTAAWAAPIPTPKQVLGHDMGEDRYVASYTETVTYWKVLAAQSDRIKLIDIGPTTEGRRQMMAAVSSPANLARLDHFRDVSVKLGRATGLGESEARALAAEGKALVWVDGGIHASEVLTHAAIIAEVHDLVGSDDREAQHIRNNVITLFAADNPDGQELVANWYMRFADPAQREENFQSLPKLYHPYIGHDNNRDFYMAEMAETQNITRVLFHDWRPQIVLNQHQTGPAGTVVFIPPFRNPFNFNYNPLVITSLEEVGAAIQSRLLSEEKRGATSRNGAHYDTWYNGNLRTSSYFHNAIGILTETIGMPVPIEIQLVPERQLPGNDQPAPIAPQMWHMGQSLEYSLSIARAVLSHAANNREKLLWNFYRMGAANIEKGSQDSWTVSPKRIAQMHAASAATGAKPVQTRTRGSSAIDARFYDAVLKDPANRDARAYVIAPEQRDAPTSIRFLNALIKLGVEVEQATAPFTANGKRFPAGSYVVRTAQAYRPHIIDMFEPQDYPNNFEYPGGPPIPPADASGYTLAYQMGVNFERVLDPLVAETVATEGPLKPQPGRVTGRDRAGYLIAHGPNDVFTLSSRLLKAGQRLDWLSDPVSVAGGPNEPGALWVPASPEANAIVRASVTELGLVAEARGSAPRGARTAVRQPRVALVDVYGGLIPTGWMRWIFEKFELPYEIVHPQRLDAGNLRAAYDVVIIPEAAFDKEAAEDLGGMFRGRFTIRQPAPERIPEAYRSWLGAISADRTVPALKAFAEAGGTLIGMGESAEALVKALALPVENPLVEAQDGKVVPLPRTRFYVPGAILSGHVDQTSPIGHGLPKALDVFYDNSPVFRLTAAAPAGAATPLRFEGQQLLRSGWGWGAGALDGAAAVVDLPYGPGRVVLIGPDITLRAQSHGAFKLLFNAIYRGEAR